MLYYYGNLRQNNGNTGRICKKLWHNDRNGKARRKADFTYTIWFSELDRHTIYSVGKGRPKVMDAKGIERGLDYIDAVCVVVHGDEKGPLPIIDTKWLLRTERMVDPSDVIRQVYDWRKPKGFPDFI